MISAGGEVGVSVMVKLCQRVLDCKGMPDVCFFLDIRTRVECRTSLFNLFVIAEPLMYFCVCHGTPTNTNLEITNCV